MSKDFKCPVCGAINEQIYNDSIDEDNYLDEMIIKYYGFCGECGAVLLWKETYTLSSYDEIKVMKN